MMNPRFMNQMQQGSSAMGALESWHDQSMSLVRQGHWGALNHLLTQKANPNDGVGSFGDLTALLRGARSPKTGERLLTKKDIASINGIKMGDDYDGEKISDRAELIRARYKKTRGLISQHMNKVGDDANKNNVTVELGPEARKFFHIQNGNRGKTKREAGAGMGATNQHFGGALTDLPFSGTSGGGGGGEHTMANDYWTPKPKDPEGYGQWMGDD
jgi:hypothetical protein